jgi:hypothetical protein
MLNGYLAVMVVSAFGCAARMWLSNFLAEKYGPTFPVGTLVVNIPASPHWHDERSATRPADTKEVETFNLLISDWHVFHRGARRLSCWR